VHLRVGRRLLRKDLLQHGQVLRQELARAARGSAAAAGRGGRVDVGHRLDAPQELLVLLVGERHAPRVRVVRV